MPSIYYDSISKNIPSLSYYYNSHSQMIMHI
ncbi:hypothetical protein GMOD_00010350 [Pyrenophora seminiperda CCB06]|uniref:Uncharacterized protein n=1 Tax=Pyrenophora seminiperda CCB06 TaxID=1302712 RepID=A0A3M7M5B1_9PLEO|nr:hypothetical protein GMOD_00010350 [Pyrenophora seminiperda CCB06]